MILMFFISLVELSLGDLWYWKYDHYWNADNQRIRELRVPDVAECKNMCLQNAECNAINYKKKAEALNSCVLLGLFSPQFAKEQKKGALNSMTPTQFKSDPSWDAFYVIRDEKMNGEQRMAWLFDDMPKERRENKRTCTVRLHRSSDCISTDRFFYDMEGKEGNMDGDVLWQWTTMGKYKTVIWERYDGWLREDDNPPGYKFNHILIDMFQDRTSAISFSGDCANIEIFNEEFDLSPVLKKFSLMNYEGNCVFNGEDIYTPDSCQWACHDSNGCPGKTAQCIKFDKNFYMQGFYMRPVDGVDISLARGVVGLLPNGVINFGFFVVISVVTLVLVTLVRVALCRKLGDEEVIV